MKTSKKVLLSLTLITGIVGASTPALASSNDGHRGDKMDCEQRGEHRGGHKGPDHRIEHMIDKLDLSTQQTSEIKLLISEHRQSQSRPAAEQRQKMRQANRADFAAILNSPTFDQHSAKMLIAQRSVKYQDRKLAKMKLQHAIYQLLNAKQQQKYLKMASHRSNKMAKRMH
jgi:protein CpxP